MRLWSQTDIYHSITFFRGQQSTFITFCCLYSILLQVAYQYHPMMQPYWSLVSSNFYKIILTFLILLVTSANRKSLKHSVYCNDSIHMSMQYCSPTDKMANNLHRLSYGHVPKQLLEHVMITVITADCIQYSTVL